MDAPQRALLIALAAGATLKAHRTLDGVKVHKLHALSGEITLVEASVVRALEHRGLIASNMKFPAATYLLTEPGAAVARTLTTDPATPVTVRRA